MKKYTIYADNNFLNKDTKAYYTLDYYGGENNDDTKFILTFKNTFCWEKINDLKNAKAKAENILISDLSEIITLENLDECTIVSVPRAKALNTYVPEQLCLIEAISCATKSINNAVDGTNYILRYKNTKTTHLGRVTGRISAQGNIPKGNNANDGPEPYPGITRDTCNINADRIKGQTIILVDDIYTADCNVDEDCIQALYDAGAKEVIFYSFAKTVKRY